MRKIVFILSLLLCYVVVDMSDIADAADVLSKNGSVFGTPQNQGGNKVYVPFTPNKVKFVRHTKYLDSSQTKQSDYQQARGNRAGVSYRCAGYYMTRVYSDLNGTNLIGTLRIYVKASDVPNSTHCDAVTPPPNNAPATKPSSTVVKKINVTHPNPVVIEPRNTIKTNKIDNNEIDIDSLLALEIAENEKWLKMMQQGDPGDSNYVEPFPVIEPEVPYVYYYPFENPYYDPVDNFYSFYVAPQSQWPDVSTWNLNIIGSLPYLRSDGYADESVFKNKNQVSVDKDLEGDACLDADANIYYYEEYYDDEKDAHEDNTLCISRAEYYSCDLVRYVAIHRDGWSELDDARFENVASDLRSLVSFPLEYCNVMPNYIEPDAQPYDPFSSEAVFRNAYQIIECTNDDDSCDELVPDPYYTPSTAPEDGSGETNPNPSDGGSPRRFFW